MVRNGLDRQREKEVLPLVRTFLLGYFGHCYPEVSVRSQSSASGWGRADFQIGGVAVEFAVRRPGDRKGPYHLRLTRRDDQADDVPRRPSLGAVRFFANPFGEGDIERFRDYASLGRGNFRRTAFNVAYYYVESARRRDYCCISRNIRVRNRAT